MRLKLYYNVTKQGCHKLGPWDKDGQTSGHFFFFFLQLLFKRETRAEFCHFETWWRHDCKTVN